MLPDHIPIQGNSLVRNQTPAQVASIDRDTYLHISVRLFRRKLEVILQVHALSIPIHIGFTSILVYQAAGYGIGLSWL